MECIKGNSDGKENVEMRRLIDDAHAPEQPLEILKEKISVLEKAEHAQVHAHARDEPAALCRSILRFGNLTAEPEIHRGRGEKQSGKRRVPRAVKNVTGDDQEIFSRVPQPDAPVGDYDDYEKNNES